MNRYIYRKRQHQLSSLAVSTVPALRHTKRVLLSLFGRFGAICQALSVAREASLQHPDIEWLLICSPQLHPYCQTLLPKAKAIISIGRNDLVGLYRACREIKQFCPELGLNPWGHGIDSEYFASQAVAYRPFNSFWHKYHSTPVNSGDAISHGNFFNMLRNYFGLATVPTPNSRPYSFCPVRRILISPESSEAKRTLSPTMTQMLLQQVRTQFGKTCDIWLAASDHRYRALEGLTRLIRLEKSRHSSASFIKAITQSELMLAVDSGPMNIATALNIPTIAIFSSEAPERVVDFAQPPLVLRDPLMTGQSCQNRQCQEPLCMNRMIEHSTLFEPDNIWQCAKSVTTSEGDCIWQIAKTKIDAATQ